MDSGWRFAFGHPSDPQKDFGHATGYFSYFAKAGFGDGPADPKFDDRAWRLLDLPHDWAVEMPFEDHGDFSHGYKGVGWRSPEGSIGWYRKSFFIPKSDMGRRISVEFDGVFRDSVVWVNGFYMGREQSGYDNFRYDITDVLNWGGNNTVVVRVDASMEEGWFYEGAGIYRHVWLTKTSPLHMDYHGSFVSSEVGKGSAVVTARASLTDEGTGNVSFSIDQTILDAGGKVIGRGLLPKLSLAPGTTKEFPTRIKVLNPKLWDLENPYLYKLVTTVKSGAKVVDQTETPFGIRTMTFDANKGFFLNGKHVELKGTCNHQDHAGVGAAMPDALQEFRVKRLKEMGCNAYRTSHNPPTPELLDACDRLGMLVLDENRLMGTSPELLESLKRLVVRDRNHPCVFAWSLGNEEWGIEGNVRGEQITPPMQDFVKRLDPTRRITCAISGGWGNGISIPIDVMGFNYLEHGNVDEYHAKYPTRASFSTEESTTHHTRGIFEDENKYKDGKDYGHEAPTDRTGGEGIEKVWKYYMARPFLAGLFLWTGFDYRGEENPFRWPAISSQYATQDLCGFPKDAYYYLKTWWGNEPTLFITPHWNWKGKEGKNIQVWVRSNCDEVVLYLNGKNLGKRTMPVNSHLEWFVPYEQGALLAIGYKDGKEVKQTTVETTSDPSAIALTPDRSALKADGEDISVVTVEVKDEKGRAVPTAGNEIRFSLSGPGKIIGVGNGDPTCHEADRVVETVASVKIDNLRMKDGVSLENPKEAEPGQDDSKWPALFSGRVDDQGNVSKDKPANRVVRGSFSLGRLEDFSEIILYPKGLVEEQSVYVNGHLITQGIKRDDPVKGYPLPKDILKAGRNVYAVAGPELLRRHKWEELNQHPGAIRTVIPASPWKRSLFSGLAQVIVQSGKQAGEITLKATGKGLAPAELKLRTQTVPLRASVPEQTP